RRGIESIRLGLERTKLQFIAVFALSRGTQAARSLIDLGEQLGTLSEKTGLSVERLNALRFAADQTDSDFGALAKAFAKLSVASVEGADRTAKAGKILAGLGITTRDPEQRLLALADRFSRVTDESDRTALAVALFGQRMGPELVPLLAQGEEGLRRLLTQGARFAGGLNAEGVQALRAFGDELDALKFASQGLFAAIARGLTPALGQLTTRLREAFADPEIRAGIGTLIEGAAQFIALLVNNAETVIRVTGALAGLKTGGTFGSLFGPVGRVVGSAVGAGAGAFLPELLGVDDESRKLLGASLVEVRDLYATHLDRIRDLERQAREKGTGLSAQGINRALIAAKEEAAAVFEVLKQKTAAEVGRQQGAKPEPKGSPLDVRALLGGFSGGKAGGGGGGKSPVKTLQEEIDELVASLRTQVATFDQSSSQVQLYEFAMRGATDAQLAQARTLIEGLALKERDREASEAQVRALDELEQKARALLAPVDELTRAHLEYMQTLDELEQLQDLGRLSSSEYQTAVANLTTQFEELNLKANESLDEMTEFAREAARNIQDSFADFFFNIMQGKFSDLATDFKQTIDRMVANALAAKLLNALVGEEFLKGGGGGGAIGGLFGKLFAAFGFAAKAEGGVVRGPGTGTSDSILARLSAGEYVVRAEAVRRWGVGFLDSLNGLTLPAVPRLSFAEGGLVAASPAAPAVNQSVRIVNVIDPNLMQDYLA
ncbi:MAG: hypothetical protein ACREXU_06200, partial [Gammaproteobacteria bacterium]